MARVDGAWFFSSRGRSVRGPGADARRYFLVTCPDVADIRHNHFTHTTSAGLQARLIDYPSRVDVLTAGANRWPG
jgi:hypothetical protein